MDNLPIAATMIALCAGFWCAGAAWSRRHIYRSLRRVTAKLSVQVNGTNALKRRGYQLVKAIAKLRDKETGGAAYAQTAVNAWSTAVLQVEGDKP